MEWRDEGFVLSCRRHGETAAILDVFTERHGRHAGVVRGGASRKVAPGLQPGNQLDLTWRARLEDHIGAFVVEPIRSRAGALMVDRLALSGLNAVSALLAFALPEREAHPDLYRQSVALLDMLSTTPVWPLAYVRWELALLEELGFALDLSVCAATGSTEDLAYVSPRTGRAVSRTGAGVWANRLLPLSPSLTGDSRGSRNDVLSGLQVTGHFLSTGVASSLGEKPLPPARDALIKALARYSPD